MTNIYRTHHCAELNADNVGETVKLSGWIHRKRDHGGLLFIDLRDTNGITQCVVDTDHPQFAEIEQWRAESVITVEGEVIARSPETVNDKLPTGSIEVGIKRLNYSPRQKHCLFKLPSMTMQGRICDCNTVFSTSAVRTCIIRFACATM